MNQLLIVISSPIKSIEVNSHRLPTNILVLNVNFEKKLMYVLINLTYF